MTQANKYVSSIIQSLQEDVMIEDSAIKELIQYHPTKQLNDIEWLKLKIFFDFLFKGLFFLLKAFFDFLFKAFFDFLFKLFVDFYQRLGEEYGVSKSTELRDSPFGTGKSN